MRPYRTLALSGDKGESGVVRIFKMLQTSYSYTKWLLHQSILRI